MRLAPVFACWAIVAALAASPDAVYVENRLWQLLQKVDQHMEAEAWEDALRILREMASLDPEHPKVYLQAVVLQKRRGRVEDARSLIESLGSAGGAGRLYGMGVLGSFMGRDQDAVPLLERALEAYGAAGHAAGEAASHTALGLIEERARRWSEAEARYVAARDLLETLHDRHGLAGILSNLGKVELGRGRLDAALERQGEALSIREEIGDTAGQARTWTTIGEIRLRGGDRQGVVAAYRRSLVLRRKIKDRPGQITVLKALSSAFEEWREWDQAVVELKEARRVASAAADRKREAEILRRLGDMLVKAGRSRAAIEPLEAASALYRKLEIRGEEASTMARLGTALNGAGELLRSRKMMEEALAAGVEEPLTEAAMRTVLASACVATGEPTHALLQQERALELHRREGDRAGELGALNNLAASHLAVGDFARSRAGFEQTLELAQELGNPAAEAQARNNLGVLLAEAGDLTAALDETRAALRIRQRLQDRRRSALVQANLAETLLRLGRKEEASRELDSALAGLREAGDRGGEAFALNVLGELRRKGGETEAALDAHRRALRLAEENGLAEEEWRAHAGLAAALEAVGQEVPALEHAVLAIERVESVRARLDTGEFKMRFLSRKLGLYEQALSLLLPAGNTAASAQAVARSFELVERARARSLLEALAESREPLRRRLEPQLLRQEEEILSRLSAATVALSEAEDSRSRAVARRRLEEAEQQLERLEVRIRRRAAAYGEILYPRPCSLREAQDRILRDGEVLLSYFIGEDRAWLWVVGRKEAVVHPLAPPREIEARVASFLKEATAPGADLGGLPRDLEAAERLAGVLLPASGLPAGGRLIVVPDGPLHHVPFEALRAGERFLVETHEVAMAPSATTLRLLRERPVAIASDAFLGVGDPVPRPGDAEFPSLPFSRLELEEVAGLFTGRNSRILAGATATKPAVRSLDLDRYRFIHFATHAWYDSEVPRRSGLKLSAVRAEDPDDLLLLNEILDLKLAAEVVVLSACRSGLGEQLRGEGPIGLTRAFLNAGSRAVVVALWNVEDRTAAEFMTDFYRGLRAGETASFSLRRAKLGLLASPRSRRSRIASWAPFVLVGDPGRMGAGVNLAARAPTQRR